MESLLLLLDKMENSNYKGNMISSAIKNTYNLDTEIIESRLAIKENSMSSCVFNHLLQFKEPVFIITDKSIIQHNSIEFSYSPGAVAIDYPVGYMSTFPLGNKNDINMITQITLHEIGHIMKLNHHERKVQENKKFCLMREIKPGESFDEYTNIISPYLCKDCNKELGLYVSPIKKTLTGILKL